MGDKQEEPPVWFNNEANLRDQMRKSDWIIRVSEECHLVPPVILRYSEGSLVPRAVGVGDERSFGVPQDDMSRGYFRSSYMSGEETIFIPLLNEGTDVWRPAPAERLIDGSYRVLPTPDYDPTDETWQFPPGSRVTCERRQLSGNSVLAAVRIAPERQAG